MAGSLVGTEGGPDSATIPVGAGQTETLCRDARCRQLSSLSGGPADVRQLRLSAHTPKGLSIAVAACQGCTGSLGLVPPPHLSHGIREGKGTPQSVSISARFTICVSLSLPESILSTHRPPCPCSAPWGCAFSKSTSAGGRRCSGPRAVFYLPGERLRSSQNLVLRAIHLL